MTDHIKFPDYIYSPDSGYLYITKTNSKFIEESEYGSGFKTFSSSEDAKKYLNENNFKGVLGIRFHH